MGEVALKQTRVSYQDYLAMEEVSQERHIYWDGEIFAMAGGSETHTLLETNVGALLFNALRGRPCRAHSPNRRLRPLDAERGVYADAVVICGRSQPHPEDAQATTNPVVIVEVLSDSTEAFDRGDKFALYRRFSTLRHVLFISQKARKVEVYTRSEGGVWELRDHQGGETLSLDAIDVKLAVDDLYEGTEVTT